MSGGLKVRQSVVIYKCICLILSPIEVYRPSYLIKLKSIENVEGMKAGLFNDKATLPILLIFPLLSEEHLAVAVQA